MPNAYRGALIFCAFVGVAEFFRRCFAVAGAATLVLGASGSLTDDAQDRSYELPTSVLLRERAVVVCVRRHHRAGRRER
jgi:hypothetical protein